MIYQVVYIACHRKQEAIPGVKLIFRTGHHMTKIYRSQLMWTFTWAKKSGESDVTLATRNTSSAICLATEYSHIAAEFVPLLHENGSFSFLIWYRHRRLGREAQYTLTWLTCSAMTPFVVGLSLPPVFADCPAFNLHCARVMKNAMAPKMMVDRPTPRPIAM